MKIIARQTTILPKSAVLVLAFFQKQKPSDHPWWSQLPKPVQKVLVAWMKQKHVSLDFQKSEIFHFADGQFPTVVVLGLGEREKWNARRDRLLTRGLIRLAHAQHWLNLTVAMQRLSPAAVKDMTENMIMADYDYSLYRKTPPGGWPKVQAVTLIVKKKVLGIDQAISQGQKIGTMINHARDLSNTPGGLMTPKALSGAAVNLRSGRKLKVKVLTPPQMKKLKMGALLGVGQGSDEPPRLIVVEYFGGKKKEKPLVVVGKGITFDSGGYNLKPGNSMNEMHMDMSGGATAISAIAAMADLKLPINAVAIVPAAENMISGSGFRPGDILRSMSGVNIEIGNTDAEGRLVLADGLTYAQKFYKPGVLVDVATLTGAALVALGQEATALLTKNHDLQTAGTAIGEVSGDYVWPLPMWEEYDGLVKATFGDVTNSGKSRWGGTIEGAIFLSKFVKDVPWIHLDIAPTMSSVEGQNLAPGATGVGVRWLVELAKNYKNGKIETKHKNT